MVFDQGEASRLAGWGTDKKDAIGGPTRETIGIGGVTCELKGGGWIIKSGKVFGEQRGGGRGAQSKRSLEERKIFFMKMHSRQCFTEKGGPRGVKPPN